MLAYKYEYTPSITAVVRSIFLKVSGPFFMCKRDLGAECGVLFLI
jgi:hypothetical protein